jgi:hypothetical protein
LGSDVSISSPSSRAFGLGLLAFAAETTAVFEALVDLGLDKDELREDMMDGGLKILGLPLPFADD